MKKPDIFILRNVYSAHDDSWDDYDKLRHVEVYLDERWGIIIIKTPEGNISAHWDDWARLVEWAQEKFNKMKRDSHGN